MEQSLVEAVQQEREGLHSTQPAAVGPSQIARRNYELLVHRQSTATAALELTCSTSSLSGRGQHPLYPLCCVYCMLTCRRAKTVCCSSFCDSEKLYTVHSAASVAAAANFWRARDDVHVEQAVGCSHRGENIVPSRQEDLNLAQQHSQADAAPIHGLGLAGGLPSGSRQQASGEWAQWEPTPTSQSACTAQAAPQLAFHQGRYL